MDDQRSKEDDVRMISTSIYVTNFPNHINVKELWRVCSQFENVIDSFIPNRRSKNGKRFGFVRFIKSTNVDRLVDNLCRIWIGRFKLYANVANRPPINKGYHSQANTHINSSSDVSAFKRKHPSVINGGDQRPPNSYIQAFKIGHMSHNDEGFWVMLQFQSKTALDNFNSHVGVKSWFSSIQQASDSFSIDERVAWIDVEGVPLKVWSRNTFVKIFSKWGSLLYEEDEDASYFHKKRLCIKTTSNENIFESFKIVVKGKIFWIRVKEVSGWAPDFSDSQDDSSESDNKFVDDKSKDGYTEKVSEAEEIPDTVFEAEEPGEIKGSVTKECKHEEMKETHSEDPFNIYDLLSDELVKKHVSSEQDHGSKIVTKEDLPNDKNYLIISVYAPQELLEKKMLWQYLVHVIGGWNGDVIIMGDFNEVRTEAERFGSTFNIRGVATFNSFISTGGLVEVSLGGYSYTRAHKSATKMSKLDRFLIYENLMRNCPNISSITLDRFLSDHRPILLRKICLDYGPIPFRFFHHWFDIIGFDSFMSEAWKEIKIQEYNAMLKLAKKLKILKEKIRSWVKDKKEKAHVLKNSLKKKLADIDSILDKGEATSDVLEDRLDTMNSLTKLEKME
ncbi:RNA-directed DNA polymerase, eukaryota [Tanacetum coccineum]